MASRRKSPVTTTTTEAQHCSIDMRLKILGRLPFFAGLAEDALARINQRFVEFGYQAGETIYAAGDPAERLYVVADGKVKLLQHAPGGQDVLLDILGSGAFFGNLAAPGAAGYADTAQALTSTCVLSIRSSDFLHALEAHPQLAGKALALMSERLAAANRRVLQVSQLPVEQRIAQALLALVDRLGRPDEVGLLIDAPLSREDLAGMTGTTPETVSRVMTRLEKDGVIASGRQWAAVVNAAALAARAGEA